MTTDHGLFGVALLAFEDAASSSPYGSGPASQPPELVARDLPVEMGCHTADLRLDRVPTEAVWKRPLPTARVAYPNATDAAVVIC